MAGCGLMMFACNANGLLGPHAVAFKLHYAHLFMLGAIVLVGHRLAAQPVQTYRGAFRSALRALPWFLALCGLVGVHGLVSNGLDYQGMASDYWNTDPFSSTSRRLGVPVLAHVLGFELRLYVLFWYAILFAAFWATLRLLVRRGLSRFEALSLATSSILAFALEGPGYGEVAVLLVGIGALRFRLGPPEKMVAAAFMIATHETATPFVALAVILDGDADDGREWLAIFGLLYLAFAVSFLVTWHDDLGMALLRAGKPSAIVERTSPELVMQYPGRAVLGILVAYKLYWWPVIAAVRRRGTLSMTALTLAPLGLTLVGSDTSRLVQFGSLSLFLVVCREMGHWTTAARLKLAVANLLVPSVYVATNAGLLWGPGLYSLYLRAASAWGLPLGRVFWQ